MKQFKSVSEWLKTNPSEEEQKKVIALINKGAVNATRREVYEKENRLRKLYRFKNYCEKLGFTPPKEETEGIAKLKKEIAELSKDLPAPIRRVARAKTEVVN